MASVYRDTPLACINRTTVCNPMRVPPSTPVAAYRTGCKDHRIFLINIPGLNFHPPNHYHHSLPATASFAIGRCGSPASKAALYRVQLTATCPARPPLVSTQFSTLPIISLRPRLIAAKMGNNPSSTTKPASPAPHHSISIHGHRNHQQRDAERGQNDSSVKREVKHPIPVSHQRTAAPPEPSLAQAQGTTANNSANTNSSINYTSRPKSLQPRPTNNNSSIQPSPAGSLPSPASKPIDAKPRLDTRTGRNDDGPSKPVAVPSSHNTPTSDPRSPYSDIAIESATMPHSSIQDMSYLTRPPRLPLPIDQEIHTPGSPIIAPADLGEPLDDLGELDADGQGLARRSSGLSSASDIDKDDDIEELRVHRSRPTVPLTLEWRQGGNKVYVTGTIFQWNRKTKMVPMLVDPIFCAYATICLPQY